MCIDRRAFMAAAAAADQPGLLLLLLLLRGTAAERTAEIRLIERDVNHAPRMQESDGGGRRGGGGGAITDANQAMCVRRVRRIININVFN